MRRHRRLGQGSKAELYPSLEGVIFDMDGVLIDSHPVHREAWRMFLASLGRNVDDDQLEYILEGTRREDILRHFLGDLPEKTLAEYGRQKDFFFQENFKDVRLMPGVGALLGVVETAGMKIGLATSASSYRTRKTLEILGVQDKFAVAITGDDVPSGKPHPAIYELVSQRMAIAPERLLVLEDAPSGVRSAKSAGMWCVGVSSNGRAIALSEAGADYVIADFRDFSVERLFWLWQTITGNRVDSLA